ncbi:MAG: IclR family transcriptional regulator [Actinomycetota bacterium]
MLARAVRLLEVLAEVGVAGVSELSRRTGLPKTTVHRTAAELDALGLVERAGDGFRLGGRLFELGSRVPGRRHLRDAALPFLEDLSRATNQTVHLAVLDGGEVFYVERLVGSRSSEVPSSVADRLPLHCTATGKCVLAFGPPHLLDEVLTRPLVALTDASTTDPDELRRGLRDVRATGVAEEIGEVAGGLRSLAAPIRGHGDELIGALSATGPMDDFPVERIEPMVVMAAAGLSRRLGAR